MASEAEDEAGTPPRNGFSWALGGLIVLVVLVVLAFGTRLEHAAWADRAKRYPIPEVACVGDGCDQKMLVLQARQTEIAESVVRLGVWQLGLTIFGTLGLAFTVYFARLAWLEAKRSADAAQKSLEHTETALKEQREAAEAQSALQREQVTVARQSLVARDRPWLQVKPRARSMDCTSEFISVAGEVNITNIGRSPAVRVSLDWALFADEGSAVGYGRQLMKRRRVGLTNDFGRVIFQSEEDLLIVSFNASADASTLKEQLESSGRKTEEMFFPVLVVGTRYMSPGDQEWKYTFKAYDVILAGGSGVRLGQTVQTSQVFIRDASFVMPVT